MILSNEQKSILAHVVTHPQAWADHTAAMVGEDAVLDKIAKYRDAYLAEKDAPGYQTRFERDNQPKAPLTVEQQVTEVKAEAQRIIFAKWPIWAQQNCTDGTYPHADLEQMRADKALVLTECARLVLAIETGQTAIPQWPVI